jgi:hypothetical protein
VARLIGGRMSALGIIFRCETVPRITIRDDCVSWLVVGWWCRLRRVRAAAGVAHILQRKSIVGAVRVHSPSSDRLKLETMFSSATRAIVKRLKQRPLVLVILPISTHNASSTRPTACEASDGTRLELDGQTPDKPSCSLCNKKKVLTARPACPHLPSANLARQGDQRNYYKPRATTYTTTTPNAAFHPMPTPPPLVRM